MPLVFWPHYRRQHRQLSQAHATLCLQDQQAEDLRQWKQHYNSFPAPSFPFREIKVAGRGSGETTQLNTLHTCRDPGLQDTPAEPGGTVDRLAEETDRGLALQFIRTLRSN